MKLEIREFFLTLVRFGIGAMTDDCSQYLVQDSNSIDWMAVKTLADAQGLTAVILDGLNNLSLSCIKTYQIPKMLRLQWIGEVMQNYEARYAAYEKAISSLSGFYNQQGYKMMVLKGYACSLDWPNPKHRPCGDIDIWQFGKQKEADETIEKEKNIKVDNSHHHHTVFDWQGFMVENHYDFINVHHHPSNASFEKILKDLGQNDAYYVEVNGERVYIPSPNLHALFLLKHACIEFAASGLNLRQLLDWAFFVKSNGKKIDWKWLEDILSEYGMKRLYSMFNAICVDDLGFDSSVFPKVQVDPALKEKVLNEILCPSFPNEKPRNLLLRIIWKWNRRKANEWKHELAYKDSMWSAFWYGLWGHLLKPASI